jgi:hypothetical protein
MDCQIGNGGEFDEPRPGDSTGQDLLTDPRLKVLQSVREEGLVEGNLKLLKELEMLPTGILSGNDA